MRVIKSGDLVVLKSGGPTMTVDAVNTSIFDDDEVTGIVCVWFVGDKLERVRFEPGAIEPARLQKPSRKRKLRSKEPAGDYKVVLDEMVAAMNTPADDADSGASRKSPSKEMASGKPDASQATVQQPTIAPVPKHDVAA
jgi:uncharacterized protein YodC (DUF2158 family)